MTTVAPSEAKKLVAEITAVISNLPDAGALERAKKHGLPWFVVDHRNFSNRKLFDRELAAIIDRQEAKLVCLCGFMRVLTPDFVGHYKNRIINIHPALLPDFGGRGFYGHRVHEAVLASGKKISGCTVHFVDQKVDHGPIILQRTVPVLADDTTEDLTARVLQEEHIAYSQAIGLFAQNRLEIKGRKVIVKPA